MHLGDVMFVDVDEVLEGRADAPLHVRLDVDRVHVVVAIEGKGKAPDVGRAVCKAVL